MVYLSELYLELALLDLMSNPSVISYITQLRAANVSDTAIRDELLKSGWGKDEVDGALSPTLTAPSIHVPPPPVPRFSMWINFQYILLFVTLWIWTVALGGIWNYAIDKHIPDKLAQSGYFSSVYSTVLQGYLAAIIVAFPFFVILFLSLSKLLTVNPAIRNLKTRKFLMYFTVIVNFLYMLCQLIITVFGFLGANISTTAFPHLLVNLLIPGAVCTYLLIEVREDRRNSV